MQLSITEPQAANKPNEVRCSLTVFKIEWQWTMKMDAQSSTDQSKSSLNESADGAMPIGKESETTSDAATRRYEIKEGFAPGETKAVFWLKLGVIAVLVASALSVALSVFFYITNSEAESFEDSFLDSSSKVFDSIGRSVDLTLGVADSFVVGLVSFARYTNMEWPYVTLPDYAVRLAKIRPLANAAVISTYHVVQEEQKELWQNYSLANDDWVREALKVQASDDSYDGKVLDDFEPYGIIHNNYGPSKGPGPFLPAWQSAPVVPVYAPYNWDGAAYSALSDALPQLLESREAVITRVSNLPDLANPESVAETEVAIDWIKDFISEDNDPSEPMSDILYPIVDDAVDSVSLDRTNGTVVGILSITFFWRNLIKDILPPGTNGIVCVIANDCGQTFTYQIDGPEVVFLGLGDLHNPNYDYLAQSGVIKLRGSSDRNQDNIYTGLPLSGGRCPYWLNVYPSGVSLDQLPVSGESSTAF